MEAALFGPEDIERLWKEYGLNFDSSDSEEIPDRPRSELFHLPKPTRQFYHPFEYMHPFEVEAIKKSSSPAHWSTISNYRGWKS